MSTFKKTLVKIRRMKKIANILENYDIGYTNRFGQVTPYHILFKDHGNEIASLNKEAAIEHCLDIINELTEQYGDDPDFYVISEEERQKFIEAMQDEEVDSGMDVLFVVKDFLLKSEGLETEAKTSRLKLEKLSKKSK